MAAEVIEEVNKWAENETNGLIEEILPPDSVDENTRLILANAVYFKGMWEEQFDVSVTKDDDFFLLNGSSIKVPYMTSWERQYIRYFEGFKVLRLPYKQGEDKRKFSINTSLFGNFRIPKFKIEFEFQAVEVLKELGMVLPFFGGDLTEMVYSTITNPTEKLFVSEIFHKAFVEVNEEGTEAAAVSVGVVSLQCLTIETKYDFVADHPFMFVIREDVSGMVLFIGQLLEPSTN
ncbi:hypothetical protein ACP275_06G145900 [Erythranthe tilingii]